MVFYCRRLSLTLSLRKILSSKLEYYFTLRTDWIDAHFSISPLRAPLHKLQPSAFRFYPQSQRGSKWIEIWKDDPKLSSFCLPKGDSSLRETSNCLYNILGTCYFPKKQCWRHSWSANSFQQLCDLWSISQHHQQ